MNKKLPINLVTGGSGFLGSHLIDRLMRDGEEVVCIDNFLTGDLQNIIRWLNNPKFKLVNHDITKPIFLRADKIWHLGSPASPVDYQFDPINTSKTIFLGSLNMLELAQKLKAKIFLASTSEIYGNPKLHPQKEDYFGNVNPVGIRSCYAEGKRINESLFFDCQRMYNLDIRIARIFNTYGPRMRKNDGRVISNFIIQALKSQPLTISGNGLQTRSFCYVDDLISGMIKVMDGKISGPVNLGNDKELKILDLANLIKYKINKNLKFVFKDLPLDDPLRRQPSIELAKKTYNWHPKVTLESGLEFTINYFKNSIK